MALLFGVCFFLYFLKLSAGKGFWCNKLSWFVTELPKKIFVSFLIKFKLGQLFG